jgi:oligopeptide transport system permease protein
MVVTTEKREAVEAFAQQVEVVEGRSLWKDARRRFLRNKAALTSLIILTIIGLAVIVGPHLSQYTFDDPDWGAMQAPRTWRPATGSAPTAWGAICSCAPCSADASR